MKSFPTLMLPLLCVSQALTAGHVKADPPGEPKRISLSVRDADLKDLLRAAAEDTDYNLTFEVDLDTRVKGLDLKGMTFQEILDQILPNFGFSYTLSGRTVHIQKSDGALRFYQVDQLSMRRQGSKEFMVNASGQTIQTGMGSSGGGGNSGSSGGSGGQGQGGSSGSGGQASSYTSMLSSGNGYDPWSELQAGLSTIVFGEPMAQDAGASSTGGVTPPGSRAFSKGSRTLIIHPDAGLVVVGADNATHSRVEKYLNEMKRRNRRQVLLEARIVEVTLNSGSQIGVDWNGILSKGAASGGTGTDISATFTPGQTLNPDLTASDHGVFNLVVANARVTAALSALARDGRLQVLSSPRLATLNNQKAILRVVREEAYFLQTSQVTPSGGLSGAIVTTTITPLVVPVGIVLDIQPQVGEDGTITLSVNPSVSEVVSVQSLTVGSSGGGGGASATLPVVDRRDLDTVVRMKNGETLVLAGIIRAKESTDDRGVPWLRRIPFLGNLFTKKEKSKTHTELAIFITPTLVEEADQVNSQRDKAEKRLEKAGVDLQPEPRKGASIKEP